MKLKTEFETVDIGDAIMAVPVGDGAETPKGVLRLNPSAAEILALLQNETSEEELVDTLCAKYENDRAEITAYVKELLNTLSESGLL